MKFICTQENIKHGLSFVSSISLKNINLPILNNVLIQAQNNIIQLMATNLEIGITCTIRGKIDTEGTYTIPAKLLCDYIQLLPKENIEFTLTEGPEHNSTLLVECKNYKTKIKGMPASDFPLIPKVDPGFSYLCPLEDFKKALSQVIFAVSVNDARPEICGVYMYFFKNFLTLAATDSYRLAEKTLSLVSQDKNTENEKKIIVPSRALYELLRILNNVKNAEDIENIENFYIHVAENQILFKIGNIELTSRLIEGQYPDYKQIIPQKNETSVDISTNDLIQAIRAASLFSRVGIFDVTLEFIPETSEVIVKSSSTQVGENTSKISAKITGKKNSTALNYRYILDGLLNAGSDEILLQIIDDSNPCVLQAKDSQGYLYLIMPIKQ